MKNFNANKVGASRRSARMPAELFPGMGEAVFARTVGRKAANGELETWSDVANRVALGNTLLVKGAEVDKTQMAQFIEQAALLMSGRHLQHGDAGQVGRPSEVFTNCSSAAMSFAEYLLLLSGSGVGRSYANVLMVVDWAKHMPKVEPVIDQGHPDVSAGRVRAMTRENAIAFYGPNVRLHYHTVEDSREGWAKAMELIETMTFAGVYGDDVVIMDFSLVRPYGSPIAGMQDRPASGPGPMMDALRQAQQVRGSNMMPWKSTMYVDHFLAECVVVGGARRAARMACKPWDDEGIFEFIAIKSDAGLWSSNNSILVDAEFWAYVNGEKTGPMAGHAKAVYESACYHGYHDNTGEPGFINVDKLGGNEEGMAEVLMSGDWFGTDKYRPSVSAQPLMHKIGQVVMNMKYKFIVNPCAEVPLAVYGGYCCIADTVPFYTTSDDEYEAVCRAAVRALIRANTMTALYGREVARTNRIGVGFTGIFEYAFARFGFGWKDLVNEEVSLPFWMTLGRMKRAIDDEARRYSLELGVAMPHTTTILKPAGTTSKLFGLSEGAHLPSRREYLRWVQFRSDSPLIAGYAALGYPVRELSSYRDTTVVGFPTQLAICQLGMGDKLVTAAEATPEEQYRWLQLVEKYWIDGVTEGGAPLRSGTGGQVSYTLKYDPKVVSYAEFKQTIQTLQPTVKCCSVMPQTDCSAYEYQPEEPISAEDFAALMDVIAVRSVQLVDMVKKPEEDIGIEHIACDGACPVDFGSKKAA